VAEAVAGEDAAATAAPAPAAPAQPELSTARPAADAPAAPRANADTVAALGAEIARKLDARSTRFELQLDPLGLGQVQVSLEITGGEVSALLHFERPRSPPNCAPAPLS
jgi:flagellar hook-length control protein FliK